MSGTSFQDEDRAIAVSGDQGEVQENVEGQNPIEQGEDMRTFEEKFAELNNRFENEKNARHLEYQKREQDREQERKKKR